MLPCHGECNIPDGYLEEQKRLIATLRQDFIERIDHRNALMGFGHDVARAERMFETQILDSGMEFEEARALLQQMHATNMRMQQRGREKQV